MRRAPRHDERTPWAYPVLDDKAPDADRPLHAFMDWPSIDTATEALCRASVRPGHAIERTLDEVLADTDGRMLLCRPCLAAIEASSREEPSAFVGDFADVGQRPGQPAASPETVITLPTTNPVRDATVAPVVVATPPAPSADAPDPLGWLDDEVNDPPHPFSI